MATDKLYNQRRIFRVRMVRTVNHLYGLLFPDVVPAYSETPRRKFLVLISLAVMLATAVGAWLFLPH